MASASLHPAAKSSQISFPMEEQLAIIRNSLQRIQNMKSFLPADLNTQSECDGIVSTLFDRVDDLEKFIVNNADDSTAEKGSSFGENRETGVRGIHVETSSLVGRVRNVFLAATNIRESFDGLATRVSQYLRIE